MDKISITARFRADYRKVKGREKECSWLREVAELLAAGTPLPDRYQDAPMLDRRGNEAARSCRVGGCLLVYRRKGDRLWLVRLYPLKEKNKITAPALWLKTLLRSPAKSALTLLLIAAATFMLLYTVLDYAITKRTYDDTYSQYHGYVMLEQTESEFDEEIYYFQALPYFLYSDPDSMYVTNTEQLAYEDYHLPGFDGSDIDEILALPYLDKVNTRYMTAGISEYERIETAFNDFTKTYFDYTDRVIVEATLKETYTGVSGDMITSLQGGSSIGIDIGDIKVLAGNEESLRQDTYYIDDSSLCVLAPVWPEDSERPGIIWDSVVALEAVSSYLDNVLTPDMIEGLVPGERYVFVLKIDPKCVTSYGVSDDTHRDFPYAFIGDETIGGFWPYIYSLKGKPENYLETAEFANLRKLIEVTDADRKTLDVVYTDDMSSIKRYQDGKLMPVQGRMLTAEDTKNSAPVCVIGENFAKAHGLSVGDRITLQLGDRLFEQYTALGAIAASPKRYADNFTEQEFEIVGTFFESGLGKLSDKELFYAYSDNTVFVPQSFLPVSEEVLSEHEFKPGEISFVIPDAGSIMAFKEEYTDELAAMGYTVAFYDGGYYEYIDTYCESNFVPNTVVFSNDLSRVCPSDVTFKEGWGMDILEKRSTYCVISKNLAETLGISIGDRIELCRQDRLSNIYAGSPVQLSYEEAMEIYHNTTAKPTVIGIADDALSRVYLPANMWESYAIIVGGVLRLDLAEYTLNDYHEALNFRAYAERQLNGTAAMLSMETEEADRIYQTYRLIELLYPIAFAVAILLGGVLPGIIILQSAKEAALLRILGTTKRRTRAMLTLEQIMLCLLGLVLAAAALIAVKGRELYEVAGVLLVYLGVHFAFCASSSTAASVSVTKRKVLDMLQVKE